MPQAVTITSLPSAFEYVKEMGLDCAKAVKCLRVDLDDLLTFYHFKEESWQTATRTTNAIERRFGEVRRRRRPCK